MVLTHADDVTATLQRLEDQLQCRFANVEAVTLPDCGQDVQDMATFVCVYRHGNLKRNTLATAPSSASAHA